MPKYFGNYGGAYVPEMMRTVLEDLDKSFNTLKNSKTFQKELQDLYQNFVGRPTPLIHAKNLSKHLKGAQIFLKNEGACHTGAHKINHCVGQILLAKHMGKKKIIAETGAGQHGLATATVCAKFNMECEIYMGEKDYFRQRPNVMWMETLGAKVIPVTEGSKTLKDAVNMAIKMWINSSKDTHYLLGSALGPHPYPTIVRYFQEIVGKEAKQQIKKIHNIKKPDAIIACIGGGSNAIGIFSAFIEDTDVKLIAVEAGGKSKKPGEHAARFQGGKVGIIQGYKSYFLQDDDGNLQDTHSISAGLDYAGIGPEHAMLHDENRVQYTSATNEEVIYAIKLLAKHEGVFPALESAHAVVEAIKLAPTMNQNQSIIINISGRADKDIFILGPYLAEDTWKEYLKSQTN